jgi:hypothetical protein
MLTSILVFGSKATATFTSASGKQEVLTMRGDFFDTQADIIDEAAGDMFLFSLTLYPLSITPSSLITPRCSLIVLTPSPILTPIRPRSSPHRPQDPQR